MLGNWYYIVLSSISYNYRILNKTFRIHIQKKYLKPKNILKKKTVETKVHVHKKTAKTLVYVQENRLDRCLCLQ